MLGNQFEIKKLKCTGGSFVGEQGEQYVEATGGAWSAQEPGRCSQRVLRFYIDFPQGAARNDVTLPAGRVFFNTAMWESEEMRASQRLKAGVESELEALRSEQAATRAAEESGMGLVDQANALRKAVKRAERYEELKYSLDAYKKALPDSRGSLQGPDGIEVAAAGGVSIKANGPKNLFGALGDVYHILGRFEVKPAAAADA